MSPVGDATNPFAGTIAEMTWSEVDAAARRGAVVLWAIGVIEQHGPHLPAGTDVYVPMSTLLGVKAELAQQGREALVLPPFYWGVNHVSSAFPASYGLSPDLMVATISELLQSVARDGFGHIFCLSGHGDALHNSSLHRGVQQAREGGSTCQFHHLVDAPLAARIGVAQDDPAIVVLPETPDAPQLVTPFADVHAGDWESSLMFVGGDGLVRAGYEELPDTGLDADDLARWRLGGRDARAVTPEGYLGDPASATPDRGRGWWQARVTATTRGILRVLDAP